MPARPSAPSPALLALRRTLVREEYEEVMEAMDAVERGDTDLAPLAQELADLLYVTYGALLALGVDPDAVFEEVHRANMHKTTGPRREDGKQLKPEGWQPANVRGVLEGLSAEKGLPSGTTRTANLTAED
ncbi:MazG nucleotide pyrophosphohydrolase domain-containing protein [Deinococcus pimensis]|uniref:MazG nucleotide pyrophosphohydrolase domain-containing protein n=1 Tax=Deinococcus pimensis TaxID=309888 RepID=UPI0005EBD053|nr:MazG nucleotide pyrophosphohydrolase domain-containing protein [Deinococcus pimensis]